jgi:MerR family transcriptional regulator, copper efflux regulator
VPLPVHTLREPGWSAHLVSDILDEKLLELAFMRITEAARRLGTSARMLRYREDLGLLPQVRDRSGRFERAGSGGALAPRTPRGPSHRQFSEEDVEAVAAALQLERRYDISPASLAFGVRVLAEPGVRAAVADLGRRLGRVPAPASRAVDFEKERALRLLSRG